jgi:hypothetical protein
VCSAQLLIVRLVRLCENAGMRSILERGCVRAGAVVAIAAIVGVAVGTPAGAATGNRSRRDRRISIDGGVVIAPDETVNGPVVSVHGPAVINGVVTDKVYVGRGDLRINGRVTGDVLVVDGDAIVNGRVGGDVIAVLGRVTVHSGARVGGDVVSRRDPQVASGTVAGKVRHFNLSSIFRGFLIAFLLFSWLAVTVSVAILGLLFVWLLPRAADATVAAGRRVWPSLGWGALVGIVGPILGVLVLVTIVGIPLGLGVLAALGALSPLGYVVASLSLGRTMVKGTSTGRRIGAFFAGFGILRAAALIPGIGFLVWFVACLYGLGALTIAAWRAGHVSAAPTQTPVPSPQPAPAAGTRGPTATTAPDSAE